MQFITCINSGYLGFTRNFFSTCKKHGINLPVTVYCLDKVAFSACNEMGVNAVEHYIDASSALTVFGGKDFRIITQEKLACIAHAISNSLYTSTCFIDMDIAVLKDFRSYLDTLLLLNPSTLVFAQCDENAERCSPRRCICLCTGFIIFRHDPSITELLSTVIAKSHTIGNNFSSDQDLLGSFVRHIQYTSLDVSLFPNGYRCGFRPGVETYTKLDNVIGRAYIVHFNYLYGSQKELAMRTWGVYE